MYPKRPIYLFSLLTEDKTIKCKHVKRIKLDEIVRLLYNIVLKFSRNFGKMIEER